MTGYEYGNARLHAMKSRLLSQKELEAVVQTGSIQGLIAELAKTSYRSSLESALARTTGIECVTQTLHFELQNTLGQLRSFYRDDPGKIVALLLRAYDIHNLKAILRGISRNAPAGEILLTLLPVGELSYADLVELADASDVRAVIDILASLMLPFARPLLHLQAKHPGAAEFEMEMALDGWYFKESQKYIKKKRFKGKDLLVTYFNLESDLINLLTVLRFTHSPEERAFLDQIVAAGKLDALFVGPGRLSFALLEQVVRQDSIESAITLLEATPYEAPLKSGLENYRRSGRLSAIETSLRGYRLRWLVPLIQKDPLGIGVVLGFMALKINEIHNLSWIAHGINIGLTSDVIRAEVEWIE